MKNAPKKSSALPMLLIVLVLIAVVGGGWWLYSSSKPANVANGSSQGSPTPRPAQIPTNAPVGASPPHMLGSPTASVTVEEFADFQCGSCAATHPTVKEIQSIYGSKIRLIFREYPLSMHEKAYDAALAAEAAGMQGKFWAMQDQLFQNQQTWSAANANHKQLWTDYAEKIGLNVQQFQSDMSGMATKSRVELDRARGAALNVSSTPTLYVNGQSVPYPEMNVAGLRRIIDAELQKAASQPAPATAVSPRANTAANSNSNSR